MTKQKKNNNNTSLIFWGELKVLSNNSFNNAMSSYFGVRGWSRKKYFSNLYMFNIFSNITNLTNEHSFILNYYFSTNISTFGKNLDKLNKRTLQFLIQTGSLNGLKFKMGLPTRGQRTHTNSKTIAREVLKIRQKRRRVTN